MSGRVPRWRLCSSAALLALAANGCDTAADLGYTTHGFDNYHCRAPEDLESVSEEERELVEGGLSRDQVCNGLRQCPLGDDEEGCDGDATDVRSDGTSRPCGSFDFVCGDSRTCIERSRECDGTEDCTDGSDEADCGPFSREGHVFGECRDGLDNDGDGLGDCTDDGCNGSLECAAASCPETLISGEPPAASGELAGYRDDTHAICTMTSRGSDRSHEWTVPSSGCFEIAAEGVGFGPVLQVQAGCDGAVLGCSDGVAGVARVWLSLAAGSRVLVVVDGFEGSSGGEYFLTITPSSNCE